MITLCYAALNLRKRTPGLNLFSVFSDWVKWNSSVSIICLNLVLKIQWWIIAINFVLFFFTSFHIYWPFSFWFSFLGLSWKNDWQPVLTSSPGPPQCKTYITLTKNRMFNPTFHTITKVLIGFKAEEQLVSQTVNSCMFLHASINVPING